MSCALYRDLSWLPPPPEDFNSRCRQLGTASGNWGAGAADLAKFALTEAQLGRLARVMQSARQAGRSGEPLVGFKLGVLSNATTELIVPALVATAPRHGISLECVVSPFDQVAQSSLDSQSAIYRAKPDAVLLALDYRGLSLTATPGDIEASQDCLDGVRNFLTRIIRAIREHSMAMPILSTIARPPETIFGSFDVFLQGTQRNLIDAVNRIILQLAGSESCGLLDAAGLAETVGLAEWHDPIAWNVARQPFASQFIPCYAEHVCRLIGAVLNRGRRVLVLDLDNTLWGGVVAEDGMEGIQIGAGDPIGEAHLTLQRAALDLRDRGIILAVASKNDSDIARSPFLHHPDMLLEEQHIAVFRANWLPKPANLAAIAAELALDLSSFVFLDDHPFERRMVRELLPQVAVPELPDDPAYYARMLLAAGYFEGRVFTSEDRARADLYQVRNRLPPRVQGQEGVEDYLRSLQMLITVRPFDAIGRSRIAQLINKSNQFNLTTRRYSDGQIAALERDPSCATFQVRLTDVLGDSGMISVVIVRRDGTSWMVDTWLMSCRVLGRNVEEAVLQYLVSCGVELGIRRMIGEYRPSGRNQLVEQHYAKLGFTLCESRPDGTSIWSLDLAAPPQRPDVCIRVDGVDPRCHTGAKPHIQ